MKCAGLLLCMFGLLTIIGWDVWFSQDWKMLIGELLIIIGAVSWAFSNVYYRLNLQHLPKITTSAYQMLFGAIGLTIAAFITELGQPIELNLQSVYYILFTGLLSSALCFTIWFMILSVIDVVSATISTLLVPFFGLTFSALILGEEMTFSIMLGSCLMIIGIIITHLKKRQRA